MFLLVAITLAGIALLYASGFLLWRGLRDPPTLCIAGFSVAAGIQTVLVFGPWPPLLPIEQMRWVPLLAFGFGFSCILAFVVLWDATRVTALRALLLAVSALPLLAVLGVLLVDWRAAVTSSGDWSRLGYYLMYVPEALAAIVPVVYFGWSWWRSAPGAHRRASVWLMSPFLYWLVHDGLSNAVLAHAMPARFAFIASYPDELIPLNVARLVLGVAVGVAAVVRWRSERGSRDDLRLALFALLAFALSLPQLAGFLVHVLLNVLMFLWILYGVARAEVLDVDLRLKRTAGWGVLLAVAALVAIMGREASILFGFGEQGLWLSAAAAGALAVHLGVQHRWSRRVADALLPHLREEGAVLDRRRLELYQAALVARGDPSRPAPRLTALRARLGITERDHAILVSALSGPQQVGGRYRLGEVIGTGSRGSVRAAFDTVARRHVAVKELRDANVAAEAEAMAQVSHLNVVKIFGVHREPGWIVMELSRDGSLEHALASGQPPLVPRLARDMLAGVQAIHAAGLVHGDIKPSNILLFGGQARLADFGVATAADDVTLPVEGAVGTVQYMAPEVARGHAPTQRSDLFSLAASLVESVTGAPFRPRQPGETVLEHRMRIAAHDIQHGVEDPVLAPWFARALAFHEEDRFTDAAQMLAAFDAVLRARSVDEARPADAQDVARA